MGEDAHVNVCMPTFDANLPLLLLRRATQHKKKIKNHFKLRKCEPEKSREMEPKKSKNFATKEGGKKVWAGCADDDVNKFCSFCFVNFCSESLAGSPKVLSSKWDTRFFPSESS